MVVEIQNYGNELINFAQILPLISVIVRTRLLPKTLRSTDIDSWVIDYPYVSERYGIPFMTIFEEAQKGEIIDLFTSGSGRVLQYDIQPNSITVEDVLDGYFCMMATLSHGVIEFNLHTRRIGKPESWLVDNKHPDMDAVKFVGIALEYFKRTNKRIKYIKGTWDKNDNTIGDSINVHQYNEARKSGLSHDQALRQTWSAKTYASYGFKKIRNFKETNEGIQLEFYK